MLKETLEYKVRVKSSIPLMVSDRTPSRWSENSWLLGDCEKYFFQTLVTRLTVKYCER